MKKLLLSCLLLVAFTALSFAAFTVETALEGNNYTGVDTTLVVASDGVMFYTGSETKNLTTGDTGIYYFKSGASKTKILRTIHHGNIKLKQALKGSEDTYVVIADSASAKIAAIQYNPSSGCSVVTVISDTIGADAYSGAISGETVYVVIPYDAGHHIGGETMIVKTFNVKTRAVATLVTYDSVLNKATWYPAAVDTLQNIAGSRMVIKGDSLYIGYGGMRSGNNHLSFFLLRQSTLTSSDSAIKRVTAADTAPSSIWAQPSSGNIAIVVAGDSIAAVRIGQDTTVGNQAGAVADSTGIWVYFYNPATLAHNGFVKADTGFKLMIGELMKPANLNALGDIYAAYDSNNKFNIAFKAREAAAENRFVWYGKGTISPTAKATAGWSDTEQVYSQSSIEVPFDGIWAMAVDSSNNVWVGAQREVDRNVVLYKQAGTSESSGSSGGGGRCVIENLTRRTGTSSLISPLRKIRDMVMETSLGRKLVDNYYKVQ